MKNFVIGLSILLGAIRILMVADAYGAQIRWLQNEHFAKSFEATAHILVGGLLVAWMYGLRISFTRILQAIPAILTNDAPITWYLSPDRDWILTTLSVLTWVEILSALLTGVAK